MFSLTSLPILSPVCHNPPLFKVRLVREALRTIPGTGRHDTLLTPDVHGAERYSSSTVRKRFEERLLRGLCVGRNTAPSVWADILLLQLLI
ncbi:Hypothetical protein SMAX5B_012724 [Scophthalmus maximus]|uniref:Uncharacterized protein n=1 Tax=Scophthalmus maximus TaxID=52904 RepID=A0A2U9BDQ6_SCOMX|nr:Hypothetical protein SMAX5B_012724 [Scophthalmus maximus]